MKNLLVVAAAVTVLGSIGGCGGGGGSSDPTPASAPTPVVQVTPPVIFNDTVTKSPNADSLNYEPGNTSHSGGSFTVNTGVWGVHAASAYTETVQGSIDPNADLVNMNIGWDIAASATPGVVTFPNITFGTMPSMPVTGNVVTTCATTCQYDTTFDIFVMASNRASNSDVGTEILINTERQVGDPDVKYLAGTLTISGVTFKIYHNAFGSNWNTIQYLAPIGTSINALNLDVKTFIQDAVQRGFESNANYLVSVEFGTEVAFGKGTTVIKEFAVN
jgi:hypothetical protein